MVFNEKGIGGYTQIYFEHLIKDLEKPDNSWLHTFITFHSDKLPFNMVFACEDLILAKCVIDSKSDPLIIVDYLTSKLYSSAISDEEYVGNEQPIITVYIAKLPIPALSSFIKPKHSEIPDLLRKINKGSSEIPHIKNGLVSSGKRFYSTVVGAGSNSKHVSDSTSNTEGVLNDSSSASAYESMFRAISQYFENNKYKANKETQLSIEKFMLDFKSDSKLSSLMFYH